MCGTDVCRYLAKSETGKADGICDLYTPWWIGYQPLSCIGFHMDASPYSFSATIKTLRFKKCLFGFIPSAELLNTIQTAQKNKNSSEPLYPLRDKTALMINDEIIDAILTELVRRFPASEKRDTAEKIGGLYQVYCGSVTETVTG